MLDKLTLRDRAYSIREQYGKDTESPVDIFALAHNIEKLTIVMYPLGEKISGACLSNRQSSVIAINSAMSRGRQRFSLAHELYHLFFDNDMKSIICSTKIGEKLDIEKEADQFASYFLVPPGSLYQKIKRIQQDHKIITIQDVVHLEQYYGVSRKAMLYRLKDEKIITDEQAREMETNVLAVATALGYNTDLYRPLPEKDQMKTLGYYITITEKLLDEDKISNGKYEEWLLDGFRDDIVYGEEPEGGELID